VAVNYLTVKLQDAINALTVERVETILSAFSCPLNDDIEAFLKNRSIEFSKRGIARTHLVISPGDREYGLLGYYTLTNKVLTISPEGISNSVKRRLERFGVFDRMTNVFNVAAPLIAQLGKNFSGSINQSISGDALIQIACDKIVGIQEELGGSLVYLECDDKPKLVDFYTRNYFRILKSGVPSEKGLIQMIRFL
jgi:hypothetical protein